MKPLQQETEMRFCITQRYVKQPTWYIECDGFATTVKRCGVFQTLLSNCNEYSWIWLDGSTVTLQVPPLSVPHWSILIDGKAVATGRLSEANWRTLWQELIWRVDNTELVYRSRRSYFKSRDRLQTIDKQVQAQWVQCCCQTEGVIKDCRDSVSPAIMIAMILNYLIN